MSGDDPTQWFRPRGAERTPADADGTPAAEGAPASEGAEPRPAADAQPPTQPLDPNAATGAEADPEAPPAVDGASTDAPTDGLDHLFGDQQDFSEESDWLPPRGDTTAVLPAASAGPATDPLGWLDGPGADDATTVALGAGAAGVGAGAVGAAAAGAYAADAAPDAVTQRFDATTEPPTGASGALPPEGGSRRLVIALAIVGGVLVIAIILALVFLFSGRNASSASPTHHAASHSASASASPSPTITSASPTPTATATQTTAPVPAPTIGSFSASPSSPPCTVPTGTVNVSFSWSTSNASQVALSIDGVADPYNNQLSGSGTLSNVPYDCSKASQGYTLLATNSAGQQTSKPLTLVRPTIVTPSPTPSASASAGADNN